MKALFKCFSLIIFYFLSYNVADANNVQITNLTYDENTNTLNFDVSWDNSFYVSSNWQDNIYIFAKYKNANGSAWEHVLFDINGHSDDAATLVLTYANTQGSDRLGMRIYHLSTSAGGFQSLNCTAKIDDNLGLFHPSFKVFAIEMIYMGHYQVDYAMGDGASANRFHAGNDTTQFVQYSGTALTVGTGPGEISTLHPDGIPVASIDYWTIEVPDYVMRYELSQGQYVEFLNCQNRLAQNTLVNVDVSGTSITDVFVMSNTPNSATFTRNGIRCDATLPSGGPITFYCDYNDNGIPNEYDDGQNIAMNYLSGSDLFAYLDWAGLRPLNELNYEGICRGEYAPVPNEMAWGNSGYTTVNINTGPTYGSADEFLNGGAVNGPIRTAQFPWRCGASATATSNRSTSGASVFGIMDLSNNVADLLISLTHASSFDPVTNGDGSISIDGKSNEGWPLYITYKGSLISNDINSVSFRRENTVPYSSGSAFYGGRGGM